jgi:hypothetical protein
MSLPRLDRVTVCCIDTNHPAAGLRAIRQSMKQCEFGRRLLVSSQLICEPGIECLAIPRFEKLEDYSFFVMKKLGRYLQTDFVLIVHWDGYVIDGSLWRDEFLEFDYIGAPWPSEIKNAVGNGGFSLRSRRLMRMLADSHIEHFHPEDAVICQVYRESLEKNGIRFADFDTAFRFSVELGEPPGPTLGFHGVFNLWRFLPRDELGPLLDLLPASHIHSDAMTQLLNKYQSLGRSEEAREILLRREKQGS